jgi:hypothetical protein
MESFLAGGPPPKFTYHRFWAQADIAIANAAYGMLFPKDTVGDSAGPSGGNDAKAAGKKHHGKKKGDK